MEKTVRLCDNCGKKGAKRFTYWVSRELDAAGDTDDVYEDIDLCLDGALVALQRVANSVGKGTPGRDTFVSLMNGLRKSHG